MAGGKPGSREATAEARERRLVQAAQKDPSRFAELYENNFASVYAYIARRVPERAVAEDSTSDVVQKELSRLPDDDGRGMPFAAWLLAVASNLMADQWKRSAREELMEDPPELATEPHLDAIDQRARLFRLVEKLPES